jgi:hypothetical protein
MTRIIFYISTLGIHPRALLEGKGIEVNGRAVEDASANAGISGIERRRNSTTCASHMFTSSE